MRRSFVVLVTLLVSTQAFALSNSNTAVSLIMISFTVPSVLFSAVAGVYVDRKQKRIVLTVTNALRAGTMLLYIFFTGSNFGVFALIVIYLTTLVFSSVSQFFNPAESTEIPLLVKRNQLLAANSLFNFTFTAMSFTNGGKVIFRSRFVTSTVFVSTTVPSYVSQNSTLYFPG